MDISEPIRAALTQFVAPQDPSAIADPLAFYVQLTAIRNHPPVGIPAFLTNGSATLAHAAYARPVDRHLALASAIRVLPRISRINREPVIAALKPELEAVIQAGEKLLVSRTTPPVEFLWHYYLLVLARQRLLMVVPEMLLKALYRRGWGGQSKEGFLHPRNVGRDEASVRLDDLAALHAAYNAVALTQELERLEPIEKLIRWHATNPPADPAPTEPWALAAFAALDDSSYAQRQVQNSTSFLAAAGPNNLLTLALLADALVTQEEVAGM